MTCDGQTLQWAVLSLVGNMGVVGVVHSDRHAYLQA